MSPLLPLSPTPNSQSTDEPQLTAHSVMRACEGCRRRKIKCDAATTNTWPCSACIRLKLHCVRPNGYDGLAETEVYEPPRQFDASQVQETFRQQLPLPDQQQLLAGASKNAPLYAPQSSYQDAPALYHSVPYNDPQTASHNLQYTPVHPSVNVVDHSYTTQNAFPTPPMHQAAHTPSSPEEYQSEYAQQDLADLLGSLKVNEAGTGRKPRTANSRIFLTLASSSLSEQQISV